MFLAQTQNLHLMVIHRVLWHKNLTQNRCLFKGGIPGGSTAGGHLVMILH